MAESSTRSVDIRRRLIGLGALVVISLAISPFLFDAAGFKERQLENRIPEPPSVRPLLEITQQNIPSAEISSEAASEVAPIVETEPPEPLPPQLETAIADRLPGPSLADDRPQFDTDGIPVAWTLQLASFKDERNAKSLRADLNKAGYKVYIRHGGDLVRVYIGPEMQRTRLEQLRDTIKEEYSLDGMIVRFTTE